jgi:hypothetical protein
MKINWNWQLENNDIWKWWQKTMGTLGRLMEITLGVHTHTHTHTDIYNTKIWKWFSIGTNFKQLEMDFWEKNLIFCWIDVLFP